MTSFIRFTPLMGARSETQSLCYVLEIDEAKILLDCGSFASETHLNRLKEIAPSIDAVLLSHADLDHIGGYVLAASKLGLTCPCFATTPCHDMGLQLYKDYYKSQREQIDFKEFTMEDIEAVFSNMHLLRYSQPYVLGGKCMGIRVSAFGAGRTIGGSFWKIKKDSEDILYAVDLNHRKERHLKRTMLLNTENFKRPSLLITDAFHDSNSEQMPTKARDLGFQEMIADRIRDNANILIPVETSTRILELCLFLDAFWEEKNISYHLIFLSHQSQATLNAAKTMLEWMGEGVAQSFVSRDQAFDFRHMKCLSSLNELDELIGPKLVLSSFPSLECGFAHDLLILWGSQTGPSTNRNCILFPERPLPGTIGGQIYDKWKEINSNKVKKVELTIPIQLKRKIPLEGEALEVHMAQERAKIMEAEQAKKEALIVPEVEESETEDEEMEEGIVQTSYDTYVKDHSNRKGFFKQAGQFKMYPVHETRNRVDDYGEVVDITMFSKYEEAINAEYMDVDNFLAGQREAVAEVAEVPAEYIQVEHQLEIKCLVGYINFEGRVDGTSMENLIKQVAPRKLVIIHGTDDRSTDMNFQFNNLVEEVACPVENETIKVAEASNLYQVVLTDSLVSSLNFSYLKDYSLSYVYGVLRKDENTAQMYLDPIPPTKQLQHVEVNIGDLKLSKLNNQLVSKGYKTQFVKGGILVINDLFIVQREQGSLVIQGSVHPDYYKVRDIVYSLQATL